MQVSGLGYIQCMLPQKNLQPLRLYLVTSETTYTSEKVTNAWKFPGGRDYIVTTAMVDYC